jgi:hypothetical protein
VKREDSASVRAEQFGLSGGHFESAFYFWNSERIVSVFTIASSLRECRYCQLCQFEWQERNDGLTGQAALSSESQSLPPFFLIRSIFGFAERIALSVCCCLVWLLRQLAPQSEREKKREDILFVYIFLSCERIFIRKLSVRKKRKNWEC